MSTYHRLIIPLLLTMLIVAVCPAQMLPTATSTLASVSPKMSTVTPAGISTRAPSPSPTVTIPIFDPFHPVTRLSLAASERALDMVAESDDNIWLITDLRVLHFTQGTWTNYLSRFNGRLIGMDSDHHVWVASDDGVQVSVWDGSAWTYFGPEAGWKPLPLPANATKIRGKVAADALGQVWLATEQDVRMFTGVRWKVFSLDDLEMPHPAYEDALPETTIHFLETSNSIWVISCYWIGPGPSGGGGARWYDGKMWQGSNSPVASGCATVVNEDKLGSIWLGLDNNLWQLNTKSGNWNHFPAPNPPEGTRFGFFTDMALDAAGNPWPELDTCGGASCYINNVRFHVTRGEWFQIGAASFDTSSLYFDANGQGWVFTSARVFRITENQLDPVAKLSILKVAVDPSGKLWILGDYKDESVLWAQTPDN
jgi:ligand-binding sensor domain-containing protein